MHRRKGLYRNRVKFLVPFGTWNNSDMASWIHRY
jgi:hypothetical protein